MLGRGVTVGRLRRPLAFVLHVLIWMCAHLVPRDRRRWTFGSLGGEGFASNSKYLYLHVVRHDDDVRAVWVGNEEVRDELTSRGYIAYSEGSIRGRWAVLRSGVICNSHGIDVPWWYTGGATVVQLWHGNGIKRLGWGSPEFEAYPPARRLFYRLIYWNWDYAIAPATGAPMGRLCQAFGMDPADILVTGYPQMDALVSHEDARDTEDDARRLVTYLPTYRQAYENEHADRFPTEAMDFADLDTVLQEYDAELVIKPHPRESLEISSESYERISVVAADRDVIPLMARTDVLVTDYSSVYLDFLLLDRPIVFFTPDRESYLRSQPLYFDYETVTPGPVADTYAECRRGLVSVLEGRDPGADARARLRERFYDVRAGEACHRTSEAIRRIAESGGDPSVAPGSEADRPGSRARGPRSGTPR